MRLMVWNSQGEVMASVLEKISKPFSVVIISELLATRHAAQFIQEIGIC